MGGRLLERWLRQPLTDKVGRTGDDTFCLIPLNDALAFILFLVRTNPNEPKLALSKGAFQEVDVWVRDESPSPDSTTQLPPCAAGRLPR